MIKKIFDNNYFKFCFIFVCIFGFYACIIHEYGFNLLITSICLIAIVLDYLYVFEKNIFDKFANAFIKWRFFIFLIIFIICVLFKVHGSSFGYYNNYFPKNNYQDNSIIFGKYRGIRSDEWAILTPYYFSQKYNDYKVDSNLMSIDGQNMIIGFNAPVKDITVLGKPLVWGYILFGNEYGISWYWCMKIILIILASFEVLYILTKKNKLLSVLGSIMISYGPSTQWWFCPHMPDVILWVMVLFSLVYHLIYNEKNWVKNVLTIIIPFVFMQFCIALFPSFQIGLGLFFGILLIALLFKDRKKIFENKKQIIRIIVVIIASLSLTGYFILTCKDALKIESNTVYPGQRVGHGGEQTFKDLFTDLSTPFLTYTDDRVPYSNPCEASTYIHFGIFMLMIMPIIIKELKKKKDRDYIVGITFMSIISIYAFFMLFGFPLWLAKLTLFSYINRMKMIFGLIMVIFTVWSINVLKSIDYKIDHKYYILAVVSYCLMLFSFIDVALTNYLPAYMYYIEIIIYAVILILIIYKRIDYAFSIIVSFVLFSSIAINPVVVGIDSVNNQPSVSKIEEIVKNDKDSYWVTQGDTLGYPSFLLLHGAKTINAINFYPDFSKWKLIDSDGKEIDKYNRYGYIFIKVSQSGVTTIDYGNTPDTIRVTMSLDDLYKWNVKYIYSNENLSNISYNGFHLEEIYKDKDIIIYELVKE